MSQTKQRRDLYQEVTDKIIAVIEAGTAPWQRGWAELAELAELGLPMNGQSSRQYNGINSMLLFLTSQERGYSDNRWFTFKQANELGAKVRKGEKSTPVYFFKMLQASERDGVAAKSTGDTPRMIPFLTEYRIFNGQQLEGIEPLNVPVREWTPMQAVTQLVERMGPRIEHGGNRAFYSPSEDYIQMPHQGAFPSAAEYSGTLLHEMAHWSGGGANRLARQFGVWGTDEYAREEIRADLASCMLGVELGVPMQLENNAAYIGSFVKRLKEDKFEIFRAAKDAQRICDFLTGRYVPEAQAQPEAVPVLAPAPVIQPVVEPVSAVVTALAAMRTKRSPSKRKADYGEVAPVAQPAMVM
jgi:antirestriction protein ArdC